MRTTRRNHASGCSGYLRLRGNRGSKLDAIHWTGRNAELTTGAVVSDDGVHVTRRTDYGIHRARLNAFRATDTRSFINECDRRLQWHDTETLIDIFGCAVQHTRKCMRGRLATRRTLINIRIARHQRSRIRTAPWEGAATALGLRQQLVDRINQRVS